MMERRKVPRLCISGEQFKLGRNGQIFQVLDLSEQGLGLRLLQGDDAYLYPVGTEVGGELKVAGKRYLIGAQVTHLTSERVGLRFTRKTPELDQALTRHLDPEHLAKELRALPANEGRLIWYHGPSGTDLLVWNEERSFSRLLLILLGQVVQWEAREGLRTGRVAPDIERDETWGAVHFESMGIEGDSAPDPIKLSVAKTFFLGSKLPENLKSWCLSRLTERG